MLETTATAILVILIVVVFGFLTFLSIYRRGDYDPCTEPFPDRYQMISTEIENCKTIADIWNCQIRFDQLLKAEINNPEYKDDIDLLLYLFDSKRNEIIQ